MKLKAYLKKEGITLREFARKIKKSHTTVYRYCTGERNPPIKTVREIHKFTGGKVSFKDF